MPMEQVQISIPKTMVSYIKIQNPRDELVRNAMLLYPYIQRQIISHGKAAELLGIHKFDLIELYGEMGISYFNMSVSEVEDDVRTLDAVLGK